MLTAIYQDSINNLREGSVLLIRSKHFQRKCINPIPTGGGGHFWPQQPKAVWHIRSFMTGVTKIHDFVYFSMCLVPLELFLKKKL